MLVVLQGNARKSVLNFVAKESVDLLIIGMYKASTRRKGLGLKGNATVIARRWVTAEFEANYSLFSHPPLDGSA